MPEKRSRRELAGCNRLAEGPAPWGGVAHTAKQGMSLICVKADMAQAGIEQFTYRSQLMWRRKLMALTAHMAQQGIARSHMSLIWRAALQGSYGAEPYELGATLRVLGPSWHENEGAKFPRPRLTDRVSKKTQGF